MDRVLDDIRVLDFGRFIAGPYCGMLLADMGAEVIRIERPGGEEDRTVGLLGPNGECMSYPNLNRNKRGVTLRLLKNEKGREVLADLVRISDVVLHNFAPEAAQLMGLEYEELTGIKEDIIVAAVSCFGSEGPYATRQGFDFIAQAMSGCLAIGGYDDRPPLRAFMYPMDYGTALCAAFGIMLALRHRDRTGEGQNVDLSLLGTALSWNSGPIAEAEVLGRKRPRIGNRGAYVGPTDLYRCRDGMVFIACIMNSLWRRLARIIGHEELIDDPDLGSDYARYENRERIDPLVARWCAERNVEEVMEELQAARIPCGPVKDLDEIVDDPHVRATRMLEFSDLEIPGLEGVPIGGVPVRMSRTPGRVDQRAPRVGEHNGEVYGELLGYDEARLAELASSGVI
jgi:crotonobetainyl-CoA:carnitine CoA-transferase CaiB-like acyl-CoA transferase